MNKQRYEVFLGGEWIRSTRATEQKSGWLHYQLRDGTNGLAGPGKWRLA